MYTENHLFPCDNFILIFHNSEFQCVEIFIRYTIQMKQTESQKIVYNMGLVLNITDKHCFDSFSNNCFTNYKSNEVHRPFIGIHLSRIEVLLITIYSRCQRTFKFIYCRRCDQRQKFGY